MHADYEHIDGGASAQCFVRFGPTPGWPIQDEAAPGWLAGSDLYIIAGARLYEAPTPVKAKLVDRTLTGVTCMIGSRARADMLHLHTLCMTSDMRYHLLGMPRELTGSQKSVVEINPTEMRRLFNAGHRLTSMGPVWRHTPPGSEAGEEEVPRGAAPNMICR